MNKTNIGWINGFIGVTIFAGSLPATRIAVMGFSPEFLTTARAAIAGMIALLCLYAFKQPKPNRLQFKSLIIVAFGVVIGFPLFTALALQTVTSAHAIVFVGLLPLSTAIFAVLRGGEKPSLPFWLFALIGSTIVVAYMFYENQHLKLSLGDLYMFAAIITCGLGYAEGGKLSRELGGWQVICWALVISLPLMLIMSIYYFPVNFDHIYIAEIAGLIYVSLFSMLIGFVFWYKGLALGGIAQVGQIQLVQPFIGLMLSALLLGEKISLAMIVVCFAVVVCVTIAKKYA
ncbi:DMT family transporter [Acinetobacter wuhouensis]|uniref:DMT family transporter n=1 Tax=Acinetobacter wuhouensis TaxID=1879050 RepID=UPI00083ADFB0|nr:DMT family transporter [Acinetobacter wuhouensis]AXQ22335.1 DMT family transporter [Acinetobacter wuhouensis]